MMKNLAKKIIVWLASTKILSFPRRIVGRIIAYVIQRKYGVVVFYDYDQEIARVFDLIIKTKKENELLVNDNEAYQIYMVVKRTEKIEGSIAEVGAYKGGSAKLICEAKGNKNLYLFDTFEGLPKLCEHDNKSQFHEGQYIGSFEDVKNYLKKYSNVYFYKGLFPATVEPVKNKKFSFVNLDVDIHESTLNCLKFFYPRMSVGGVIISHDYISARGVRKAFDEFFKNKPETIIELSGTQCLVVKL